MKAPQRVSVQREDAAAMGVTVSVRFPSDVRLIEEAVETLSFHCFGDYIPPRDLGFRLRVALAEALDNAIINGNHEDAGKSVEARVEMQPDRLRIGVSDEGAGFDPGAIAPPTDEEALERPGGRGLFIIRSLVDHVEFNDRGNTIWMTLARS